MPCRTPADDKNYGYVNFFFEKNLFFAKDIVFFCIFATHN